MGTMRAEDRFELWLEEQRIGERRRARADGREIKRHGDCQSCGAEDVDLLVDEYCARCAGYGWGYDQAEQTVAWGIIRGAARTALDMGADRETVIGAVMDALDRTSTWEPPYRSGD